jgi:hypothetical protein
MDNSVNSSYGHFERPNLSRKQLSLNILFLSLLPTASLLK